MATEIVLKRADMYKLVWSEPVDRLARRYGISGVALAKIYRSDDQENLPLGLGLVYKHLGHNQEVGGEKYEVVGTGRAASGRLRSC